MPEITLSNGLVVDDRTGEIISLPDNGTDPLDGIGWQPNDIIAMLAEGHRKAKDQADAWDKEQRLLAGELWRRMEEEGLKHYEGETIESRRVDGHKRYSAPVEKLDAAAQAGRFTDEEVLLALGAVKTLDPKKLLELLPAEKADELIEERYVSGHVRTQLRKLESPLVGVAE